MSYSTKILTAVFVVLWPALSIAQHATAAPPNSDVVAIQKVVEQVQDALTRVEKQRGTLHLPKLKSIDLTLQTIAEKEVGGTFKLWVITFGAKRDYKQTQEVVIHLSPPNANNPSKVGAASVTEALQATIISAAQGVQNAGTADYPLSFTGLTVSLAFAVQNDVNGGASITIAPINIDLSGKVSKSNTQTLKIVFDDSKTAEK
jgi:hypothetical protein